VKYDDLIGVAFAEQGRGPDTFDCYGVCMEINRRLGKALPDFADIMKTITKENIKEPEKCFDKVSGQPRTGDILLFRPMQGREMHTGVVVEPGKFLHASRDSGQVRRSELNHLLYCQRVVGVYRLKSQDVRHKAQGE
jgi:cell wall-associated NlpC family hydrolase